VIPVVLGLVILTLGGAIIALPDADERLFSFSEEHGPAPVDAVGAVVLLAGYLLLVRAVWRGRQRLPRRVVIAVLAVVLTGAALLVPAIAYDLGALWVVAVAVMAVPQAYLLLLSLRPRRRQRVPREA
jgi:hypothetical protein